MLLKNSNGTHTSLLEFGDPANEALVLLHGIGADKEMWQPQLEFFPQQGFYVLAPDLLGHGQSSKVDNLSLQDWNAQILALLDSKGLSTCTLIGVSMGGVIAQSFAIHYSHRVKRLILSDTFGELKTFIEKLLGCSQVAGFHLFKLLGTKILAKGMVAAYKEPYAFLARRYFMKSSEQADFHQLILARKAINKVQAIGKIDGTQIPTLVMVGTDFGETFIGINRKVADGIEGAEFVTLQNSKDPSNLVNPERFNQEVSSFLQSTPNQSNKAQPQAAGTH